MPRPSAGGGIQFPVSVDCGTDINVRQVSGYRACMHIRAEFYSRMGQKLSYLMNVALHSTKVCEARCMSAIRGVENYCANIFHIRSTSARTKGQFPIYFRTVSARPASQLTLSFIFSRSLLLCLFR